jgi:hypothetical protein
VEHKHRRWRGPAALAAGLATGLLISGFTVWNASQAAFTATTDNTSGITAGGAVTVNLADNDSGAAMFATTDNISASTSVSKCIQVTYAGTTPAGFSGVQLYVPAATQPAFQAPLVASDVRVTVERGTGVSNSFTVPGVAGCTGFTADAVAFYDGPLSTFLTNCSAWAYPSHANCATGWAPTNGQSKFFRFTTRLEDAVANDRQNKTMTGLKFVWEVQS